MASRRLAPISFTRKPALQTVGGGRSSIRSTIGNMIHSSACTRRTDEFITDGNSSSCTCVTLNGSGIQLAVGPQPLWLRNHNFGLAQRIMVKRLATSPHDPICIIDSACKNQLIVVSVQYGPFNTYIPIRSTTIGKSRVARDLISMHTSWRSNSDITSVTSIGYPCMRASDESSTTKHRLLHASGPHPIPPPNDSKKPKLDAKKQPYRDTSKDKKEKKFCRKRKTEKAMVAEENKSAWADSDSEESSSGTSSSSDNEEEVQSLMVDDTEEVLDFPI
ncbi:hypothetical protein F511_29272 [Dorcoceras hygrometricum]|uniref:Uncharacterized protein n=1 Tax=Dorcoceras hygrometricum TaxID=472368 RepID=A0A2Z7CVA0_9LAMI|nr:hypothetical protein F511_29272 [Dorcoceras hygrometricum]